MNRIGDNLICTAINKEIVQAFVRFNVEFLVVGGLAVSWYCPSRQADDMDLLTNPMVENSARIFDALGSLGLSGFRLDAFAKTGVQAQLKQRHYADVLTPSREGRTYEAIAAESVEGKLFDIPVRIVSVASLLQLKQEAVEKGEQWAPKHQRDIEALRQCVARTPS